MIISNETEVVPPDGSGSIREFPITFIKNMDLNRGYVPANEIQKATDDWNEIPVTLGHPEQNGRLVSVDKQPYLRVGYLKDPHTVSKDGDVFTEATAVIHLPGLRKQGEAGKLAAQKIESGRMISVSSGYRGDKLRSGTYDGEYRENVVGNLEPDHVALLPESSGVCDIQDGCKLGEGASTPMREPTSAGITANQNMNLEKAPRDALVDELCANSSTEHDNPPLLYGKRIEDLREMVGNLDKFETESMINAQERANNGIDGSDWGNGPSVNQLASNECGCHSEDDRTIHSPTANEGTCDCHNEHETTANSSVWGNSPVVSDQL